jgi:hypothetical protein
MTGTVGAVKSHAHSVSWTGVGAQHNFANVCGVTWETPDFCSGFPQLFQPKINIRRAAEGSIPGRYAYFHKVDIFVYNLEANH